MKDHYECVECGRTYTTFVGWQRHMDRAHKINLLVMCKICNMKFGTLALHKAHMQNCHNLGWIKCYEYLTQHKKRCEYMCHGIDSYKQHMRMSHDIIITKRDCGICDYSCDRNIDFIRHMKTVHNIGYICGVCKFPCMTSWGMRLHYMTDHNIILDEVLRIIRRHAVMSTLND